MNTQRILTLRNDGFGNKCQRCGHPFDDGGFCNNGHEQGETYTKEVPASATSEEVPRAEPKHKTGRVRCEVFSGCRCTICGCFFADGDDICSNGHEIGQEYERTSS